MPEPGLITRYLADLSGHLPGPIVEELADGLDQACQHHARRGLDPDAAAAAAVAEFGEPQVIAAAFTCASPARRAARRLLTAGPVVGACWAAALISGRAWTWPVPAPARILVGAALITVIGLLAAAALGRHYRLAGRAGTAGCLGIAAIDCTLLIAAPLAAPAMAWPVILAAIASAARLIYTARVLRPVLMT